jgi:hypothetical protein
MTGLDHDRRDPWAPYRPTPGSPRDLRRVVHLYRRAGFAATVDVLRRDLNDGPEASVDRLLEGRALAPHAAAAFELASASIDDAAVDSRDPDPG